MPVAANTDASSIIRENDILKRDFENLKRELQRITYENERMSRENKMLKRDMQATYDANSRIQQTMKEFVKKMNLS
jgi:predicted  nucleic acid-binding Zn-ribbon protein